MSNKEILAAQREIIQGYYNRIAIQNPSIETIIEWLESDLEYLKMEDAVEGTKDIIMNYDPHEVSTIICDVCSHQWVAVRPKGTPQLECPNCQFMNNQPSNT